MQITVPKEIRQIIDNINSLGYEAYLIGGAVRDMILNIPSNDYDLCTNMPLDQVKELLPGFKLMKENNHRNTGIIKINSQEIEISSFHGKTIEEDLFKRDFTINAIACDKDGNLIDPYNGVEDIKNKTISLVDKSGSGIDIDPLRILRALRFQAIYDFSIDEDTKQVMTSKVELLDNVAVERIYNELIKILTSANPSKTIRDNKETFCALIKELYITVGFKQNNPYHIYDVFEHTLKVLENTPNNKYLRLAALFHDIGKPATYTEDEKGIGHFFGHEFISAKLFLDFAKKYKIDKKTTALVRKLIIDHDRTMSVKPTKINYFIKENGIEYVDLLYSLKEADIRGQNPDWIEKRVLELNKEKEMYHTQLDKKIPLRVSDLKINGNKLKELGIEGKQIGIVLKAIHEKVLAEELENEENVLEDYAKKKR